MARLHHPHVELGMYPFAALRPAWDALWSAVHRRLPWTPASLAWSGDVHARWADPDCVVTHVCGWPLAAWYPDANVVGAFSLALPEATGHRYHSVLIAREPRDVRAFVAASTRAVANSRDSLSGWVSLLNATVGAEGRWPGRLRFSGAHRDSLVALQRGEADLACIDSWSLRLLEATEPELVRGLARIGLGPLIPSPAVVVRGERRAHRVDELRTAFGEAIAETGLRRSCQSLRIDGFVPLTMADYLPTLDLSTNDAAPRSCASGDPRA